MVLAAAPGRGESRAEEATLAPRIERDARMPARGGVQEARIYWLNVPLRDAVARLQALFSTPTFVDRRIDPTVRVSLIRTASDTAEVLDPIAAEHGWSVGRIGETTYVGPAGAAQVLDAAVAARAAETGKLERGLRAALARKRSLDWPRLAKPRELATGLAKRYGLRIENAELIPHDLWAAGRLSDLSFNEQMTLLLIGFDLTFELRPAERTLRLVPLDKAAMMAAMTRAPERPAVKKDDAPAERTKQVYSLRVEEKPVGAVTRELARRLGWQIEFDEAAIAQSGRSLESRVTFKVENVEQDELLDAVLRPAGLTFRRDGDKIVVVPRK